MWSLKDSLCFSDFHAFHRRNEGSGTISVARVVVSFGRGVFVHGARLAITTRHIDHLVRIVSLEVVRRSAGASRMVDNQVNHLFPDFLEN